MKASKLSKKAGFTLVELLIVIAMIAILVSVAIPVFQDSAEKARSAACLANRTAMTREIKYSEILGETVYIETILEDANDRGLCPSGGVYSYNDSLGMIVCSVHNHYDSGGTEDPDEPDEPDETEEPDDDSYYIDGIKITPTGDWEEFMARLMEMAHPDSGEVLGKGIVFCDETGIYVTSDQGQYIKKSMAESGLTLAQYAASNPNMMIKVNQAKVLTTADYGSYEWKEPVNAGDIYNYNGALYMCINCYNAKWPPLDPTNSTIWIKVSG